MFFFCKGQGLHSVQNIATLQLQHKKLCSDSCCTTKKTQISVDTQQGKLLTRALDAWKRDHPTSSAAQQPSIQRVSSSCRPPTPLRPGPSGPPQSWNSTPQRDRPGQERCCHPLSDDIIFPPSSTCLKYGKFEVQFQKKRWIVQQNHQLLRRFLLLN